MLRNKRNKVEFKNLETGDILEVNAVTAEEIQREQQRLLAAGEKPLYELHENPDVKGLDSMVRRIVREELKAQGVRQMPADGITTERSAQTGEAQKTKDLEDAKSVIAEISATPADDPEKDDRFTDKGNVKQSVIESALGRKIDKGVYLKAIQA